jgi:hypothetical protein
LSVLLVFVSPPLVTYGVCAKESGFDSVSPCDGRCDEMSDVRGGICLAWPWWLVCACNERKGEYRCDWWFGLC